MNHRLPFSIELLPLIGGRSLSALMDNPRRAALMYDLDRPDFMGQPRRPTPVPRIHLPLLAPHASPPLCCEGEAREGGPPPA